MNEEYEEYLNDLKTRYSNLKAKILHCQDFIDKCETQTGVISVAENSDKTQCEIKVAGKEGCVNIALTGSAKGGIKSITSNPSDGNMKYTLCYEDGDGKNRELVFTLNHGTDKVGKNGCDPWTIYDDNGNVKVSIGHPTLFSAKATGFSASVTGASISATGISVSLKGVTALGCGVYNSNAAASANITVTKLKTSVEENEIDAEKDKVLGNEDDTKINKSSLSNLDQEEVGFESGGPGSTEIDNPNVNIKSSVSGVKIN